MNVDSELLLDDLRRGEREGLARYFERYRTPVHDLMRRLLRDPEEAVAATEEAFTRAYRRILLHDGPLDLRGWTYGAAIDVCRDRLGEREMAGDTAGGQDAGRRAAGLRLRGRCRAKLTKPAGASRANLAGASGRRLRRSSSATRPCFSSMTWASCVPPRSRPPSAWVRTPPALSSSGPGRRFERPVEELSSGAKPATCRLAEQTAAGGVGRSLSDVELRRLREHLGYCRDCRRAMKGWDGGAVSLALFLGGTPLPEALATTPVFGMTKPVSGGSIAVAGSGTLADTLARIGCWLTSRAAAYALAAACLALAVGLAVHQPQGEQTAIFVPVTGSSRTHVTRLAVTVVRPVVVADERDVASGTYSGTSFAVPAAGETPFPVVATADFVHPTAVTRSDVDAGETPGAAGTRAPTAKGDTKAGAGGQADGRSSTGPGRSGARSGGHAKSAEARQEKAEKHQGRGRDPHVKKPGQKASKDDDKPRKNSKTH